MIRLVGVYQDGGQFYIDNDPDGARVTLTGGLIADYGMVVRGDFDTAGATLARERFAREFPQFVVRERKPPKRATREEQHARYIDCGPGARDDRDGDGS